MRTLIALASLLMTTLTPAATVYKSVGPDGQPVYSDRPPETGKIEKTFNFANLPSTAMPESVVRYRDELQKSMQKRLSDAGARGATRQPVLFTAKWCGYCRQAKGYLAEKKISYQEHDIDTPDGMRALIESGGGRGVPVLLVTGQKVQGFSRAAYDAVFAVAR